MDSNLYNIDDDVDNGDKLKDDGNSESNYTLYCEEENEDEVYDEENAWIGENNPSVSKVSVLKLFWNIMTTPIEGWKKLRREGDILNLIGCKLFYPMIIIAALSQFFEVYYTSEKSFIKLIVPVITLFLSFFFGYYSFFLFVKILLPKSVIKEIKSIYGKEYIMIGMTSLAFFAMLSNLIPPLAPLFAFLPLWTIYVMFRGMRFMKINEGLLSRTLGTISLLIVGIPLLWNWILNELLPSI